MNTHFMRMTCLNIAIVFQCMLKLLETVFTDIVFNSACISLSSLKINTCLHQQTHKETAFFIDLFSYVPSICSQIQSAGRISIEEASLLQKCNCN